MFVREIRGRSFALCLAVVACGGSKPEAAAPEVSPESEPASEDEPKKESPAAESAGATEEKTEKSDTAKGGELTEEDRKAILQLVLDDEELGHYLRVTEPGRFPLRVSGENLPSGLTKASKPIEVVSDPAPKTPVLVILAVEGGGEHATVRYRFDVEGIQGTTTLDRGARGWEILRSRIVEHFRPDAEKTEKKEKKK